MTATLDLVKHLVSIDTTSRGSNLALIDFAQEMLEGSGARCRRTYDESGKKANLFATIGPDVAGGMYFPATQMWFRSMGRIGLAIPSGQKCAMACSMAAGPAI